MEVGFGVDLGAVRVHRDAAAAASADHVNAQAYTVGTHVAFGAGRFDPVSKSGEHLLAHELAHVVQGADAGPALRRYGQRDGCPQEFLENYLWPGHPLAKRMIEHAIRSMCGAKYGNRTERNKEAAVQMKVLFGADWRQKTPELYRVLWLLYSGMEGDVMYRCTNEETTFHCQNSPGDTEYAYTHEGSDVRLCTKNLSEKDVKWFARILVHEMGHRTLGLGHGTDDESMTCAGEVDDAECYGLLAESMWANVNPEYADPASDLCEGSDDPTSTSRKVKHWDD